MAFDWSIMTEHVEIDGCPVRKIGQPGFAYAQPGMPRGLTIRKNSRFNAVPEHVHDYVEMSYVYRGRCPQTVAGERLELRRNEVLLLDALCPRGGARRGRHHAEHDRFTLFFAPESRVEPLARERGLAVFVQRAQQRDGPSGACPFLLRREPSDSALHAGDAL